MRIGIVGLGLIGGSLALATGARGYDADPATRATARRRGIDVADDLAGAVRGADVVVAAVPTASLADVLAAASRASPGAVLTDTASLKRPLAEIAAALPAGTRLVGGHPMAGSTGRGMDAADASLFRGRRWLIVPNKRTDAAASAAVGDLARAVGAEPLVLSAERHDELMTWASHLPLAVAAALARSAAGAEAVELVAGPGLLDTTRLATTPSSLALELLLADPAALRGSIDRVVEELRTLASIVDARDAVALRRYADEAAAWRAQLERTRDSSSAK